MEARISLVTLGVGDLARARRFYCDGLGWPAAKDSNDEVVFIQAGGVVLSLFGREALAKDANLPSSQGVGFSGVALAHNVASRAEVDDALAVAVSAGATLLKAGQETFWGGYAGYFADPDGHVWEVAHNPFWPLDGAGQVKLPT